jgi:hypothetical protein
MESIHTALRLGFDPVKVGGILRELNCHTVDWSRARLWGAELPVGL